LVKHPDKTTLLDILVYPFMLLVVSHLSETKLTFFNGKNRNESRDINLLKSILTFILSFVVLIVVIPLLASANRIFNDFIRFLFNDFWEVFLVIWPL
jgi:uncharacterized membrane protein